VEEGRRNEERGREGKRGRGKGGGRRGKIKRGESHMLEVLATKLES